MNIKNFLVNFMLVLSFIFSRVEGHLSDNKKLVCKFVANLGDDISKDAKFTAVVDWISMNDTSTNSLDIYVFMFAIRDFEKFATNFKLYFYLEVDASMIMDHDRYSPLNITVKPNYIDDNLNYYFGKLETSQWFKDTREGKAMATLNVKKSGIYCAVISTPQDVEKFGMTKIVTNSYGHLPYEVYVTLKSTLVYCIILTMLIALMGYTFYHYVKSNANESFKPCKVSILFKSFFWFVYLPNYISTMVRYCYTLHVRNNQSEYNDIVLFKILNWVDANVQITNRYVIFLLAVGYGTIYTGLAFGYDTPSSSPTSIHTPMPARKWNKGVFFYGLNIICFSLLKLSKMYGRDIQKIYDYFEGYTNESHINAYYFISPAIDFLSVSFPLYWTTISFIHYLRNFLAIHKGSSKATDSNQHLVKLRKSYRLSIVLILLIPVIYGSIYLGIIVQEVNYGGRKANRSPYGNYLITEPEEFFDFASKKANVLIKLWVNYITVISSMLFTYFYWMKDNLESS